MRKRNGRRYFVTGILFLLSFHLRTDARAQSNEVSITFINKTAGQVLLRRSGNASRPGTVGREKNVAPGASTTESSVPGENWTVLSGNQAIAQYTASAKLKQRFPIGGNAPVPGGTAGAKGTPGSGLPALSTVTFTNSTSKVVTVNRVDSGKDPVPFATLDAGKSISMQALAGQQWSFLNTNGKEFGTYRVTASPRQSYAISGGGGSPVAPVPGGGGGGKNQGPAPADPIGNTGSGVTAREARQVVDYHNQKRAEVGTPKVAWSAKIAKYAQGRADTIARTRQFAHLPQGQNPYGENLAQGGSSGGGASGYTVISACDGWYAEKKKMPKGARVMTVDLFNRGVGHYTQMVWKGTTEIGVGIATFQQNGFTMTVVVCCYNPPGNFINGAIY